MQSVNELAQKRRPISHEAYKPNLYNDHFQNFKRYNIPKAQLIIADIPYNVGKDAYGSNPSWYIGGDNANGESKLANTEFFDTDKDFRVSEFLHFASQMLKKEPKETGNAPCMIVFCEFEQQFELITKAKEYGLNFLHSHLRASPRPPRKKRPTRNGFPYRPFGLDVRRNHAFFEGVGWEGITVNSHLNFDKNELARHNHPLPYENRNKIYFWKVAF